MKTTLYHGSSQEITEISSKSGMYFTSDIDVAKQYADSNNQGSWIYSIEIETEDAEIWEDYEEFDCLGYQLEEGDPKITFNPECGNYCIVNASDYNFTLIEKY